MLGFTRYQWTVLGDRRRAGQDPRSNASGGPFLVGMVAARGTDTVVGVLFYVGFIPLLGPLFMPWVIETRDRRLMD